MFGDLVRILVLAAAAAPYVFLELSRMIVCGSWFSSSSIMKHHTSSIIIMYHYSLSSSPSSWHIIITNHYESSSSSSSETSSSSSTSLSSSINIIIIIFFSSSSSLSSLHLSTFSSSRHHRRRRRDRVDVCLPFRVVSAARSGTARKRLRSAPGFPETETAPNGPLFNCKSLRIWSQPGTQNFSPSDSSCLELPDWSLHHKQILEN